MGMLTGRVALVTGGGRGIGEASGRKLVEHGAKVIFADINYDNVKKVADSINAEGGNAKALEFDVADFANIEKKIAEAKDMFGRIDILVNVAGIGDTRQIYEITNESWDRMVDIDLKATFFVSQAVLPIMKEQNYGKMVFLSSVAGQRGGASADASYSAAKAGCMTLSHCFAMHGAAWNITSNVICPGWIETDMGKTMSWYQMDPKDHVPLKRYGQAEDVANVVLFYSSDLSAYVTGDYTNVNGGIYIN